jgi:hypothetical protein
MGKKAIDITAAEHFISVNLNDALKQPILFSD